MPKIKVSYSDYKYKNNEESIIKISYMDSDVEDSRHFVRECFLFEFKDFDMLYGRFLANETLHRTHSFSPYSGCEINLTKDEFKKLLKILKNRTKYEEAEMNNFITSFPLISKFIRRTKRFWDVD